MRCRAGKSGSTLTSTTNPMPETGYLTTQRASLGVAVMPSAPLRFLKSWIQAGLGFIVCIVLPILVYAQAVPFADGSIGVAERTIIATALAYFVVVYCGSRLETFPGASLMDQAAYIAPIVTICFATIGVGLLAWRLEYSRVQFFGSGFLVFAWVLGAAHLRVRFFTRSYAVVPAPSLTTMPSVKSCRWLNLDDAVARSVRLDGIVADLSNGLSERELSELARAAISGMPVLDRRYIFESLTGRTPLSGLSPRRRKPAPHDARPMLKLLRSGRLCPNSNHHALAILGRGTECAFQRRQFCASCGHRGDICERAGFVYCFRGGGPSVPLSLIRRTCLGQKSILQVGARSGSVRVAGDCRPARCGQKLVPETGTIMNTLLAGPGGIDVDVFRGRAVLYNPVSSLRT